MFWDNWPSWITELLGGATLSGLLCLTFKFLFHFQPDMVILGTVSSGVGISVFYEFVLDPNKTINHKPMVDIGQRAVGQALGLLIWSLLT